MEISIEKRLKSCQEKSGLYPPPENFSCYAPEHHIHSQSGIKFTHTTAILELSEAWVAGHQTGHYSDSTLIQVKGVFIHE